ncbi:MAG: hypothetical protein DIU72_006935 [Pseudomonadota bacterium]|nr:MAG: hypothetical protein DIU72_00015 [Pseudomonadota bacterium]
MKRFVMATIAALALVGTASTALAQETVIREADKVVYKKRTIIDFNDVTLEGELVKPEGSYMHTHRTAKFTTLINYRTSFVPELQKSVDNL